MIDAGQERGRGKETHKGQNPNSQILIRTKSDKYIVERLIYGLIIRMEIKGNIKIT